MNEASRAFSITASTVKLNNGISLPVAEHGANGGTPLLFLHGYPDSWRSFAHVLPLLPPSIRAIVPTQRGYGDADKPADGYAIRDLADDAVKILDKLGIERTFIAGHSMGSMVAQRIAIDSPERVMGLVLIGSAPASRGNAGLEELWQTTVSTLEGPISRDFAFEFQSSTLGQPIPSQLLDTIVDESLKVPVHVWKEALHKLLEVDHTDDLSRIEAPTLVMWGARDGLFPAPDQNALLTRIPHAELSFYERAGHSIHWEEPERFALDITSFVEGSRPSRWSS